MEEKKIQIQSWLEDNLYERFVAACKKNLITRAAIIRQLINKWVEENEENKK